VGRSIQTPAGTDGLLVRQTASKFLAATLPTALLSSDPVGFVRAQAGTHKSDDGILGLLAVATDSDRECGTRCDAIEDLADASVSLPASTIRPLLEDEHSEVRTFALALVALCNDNTPLLAEAKTIADSNNDVAFRQELAILEGTVRGV
jgi:hypothetical protein